MATSAIQICSNALNMLGSGSISSFDEDPTGLAGALWDNSRRATLRSAEWSSCRLRVRLAQLATKPEDWAFAYQLPSDYLRLVRAGERFEVLDYELEGRKLLTDGTNILLLYVYDNTDVGSWDTLLVEAMELHMAWRLAYAITKSQSRSDACKKDFLDFVGLARGVNRDESPMDAMGDRPLQNSRYTGRGRR